MLKREQPCEGMLATADQRLPASWVIENPSSLIKASLGASKALVAPCG